MRQQTRCAVPTCTQTKPYTQYMCPQHWALVPVSDKQAVNKAYGTYKYLPILETALRLREAQAAALKSISP
jgi:hypothetical protein